MARIQWHQHVRRRRPAKERERFGAVLQRHYRTIFASNQMVISPPCIDKERARFLADFAVTAKES
jgi:hypothetical protein